VCLVADPEVQRKGPSTGRIARLHRTDLLNWGS
jgi:hypothetical protein